VGVNVYCEVVPVCDKAYRYEWEELSLDQKLEISKNIIFLFDTIKKEFGFNAKELGENCSSLWRGPKLNSSVGGSPKSLHLIGRAIDLPMSFFRIWPEGWRKTNRKKLGRIGSFLYYVFQGKNKGLYIHLQLGEVN